MRSCQTETYPLQASNCTNNEEVKQQSRSKPKLKEQVSFLKKSLMHKQELIIRTRNLSIANKIHQRGLNLAKSRDMHLAFDAFVSAMEIRERYAPNSFVLATSFTHVGLAILDRDLMNSDNYSKVAVKCLCAALDILKDCYVKQKRNIIIHGTNNKITLLDLAKTACYVARAHRQRDDIDAALENVCYSLRILGIGENQEPSLQNRNRDYRDVMVLCCTTIAQILAIRMQEQFQDKEKATRWFKLAITIREIDSKSDPIPLAICHADFASFLHDIRDFSGALKNYELAWKLRRRVYKRCKRKKRKNYDNLADMCHILNNTGLVFRSMGKLDKAYIYLKRALDSLPPDSSQIEVAYIAGNLSRLTLEYIE